MNFGAILTAAFGGVVLLICVGATCEAVALWRADHEERERERAVRAERVQTAQGRKVERQRRLLALADAVEAAPIHEKQRLQLEAEALADFGPDAA